MMIKKPTETLIETISVVFGILGVSLALIGVIFQHPFPWITSKKWWFVPEQIHNPWQLAYYQISPFVIVCRSEGDIVYNLWFYKIDATSTGISAVIGAVFGLIGVLRKKRRISLAGGAIIFFSIIAFGTCLPGQYPYISWGFGAALTFYGSLGLITSSLMDYVEDKLLKDRLQLRRLMESWARTSRI